MKLKLCANNRWTPDAAGLLQRQLPQLKVQTVPCLRKCGPCSELLVAVLDGETVKALDPEDLLRQVRQALADG